MLLMIKPWVSRILLAAVAVAVFSFASVQLALAETVRSDSYEITEAQFGSGAEQELCSDGYCAQASIGDLSTGEQSSDSYTAQFEPLTEESEPMLEMIVEPGIANLGVLSVDRTATKTTTVKVRNYLSDGYMLYVNGAPPSYEGHSLATPTTPTASTMGSEQFAINVVENSEPEMGSDPVQQPSIDFAFGQVAPNYATPNLFMYVDGAMIASSDRETGQTDYTISMIVNVSGNTPAGHFVGDFSVMVVPVF